MVVALALMRIPVLLAWPAEHYYWLNPFLSSHPYTPIENRNVFASTTLRYCRLFYMKVQDLKVNKNVKDIGTQMKRGEFRYCT